MLRKFWQGKLPLWLNFWVLAVLPIGSIRLALYLYKQDLVSLALIYGYYSVSFLDAVISIYSLIIMVVIWRSSDNYEGSPFIAAGAKLAVILAALITFLSVG